MLLAVDIGNSNISLGVFQGEELRATWRIATDVNKQADEYEALFQGMLSIRSLQPACIKESVICSVVPPLTGVFQEFCERYLGHKPLIVGMGVKTGIRINYESPRDVGADRVADAVAASHTYAGPVIVVDFGTATVIDASRSAPRWYSATANPEALRPINTITAASIARPIKSNSCSAGGRSVRTPTGSVWASRPMIGRLTNTSGARRVNASCASRWPNRSRRSQNAMAHIITAPVHSNPDHHMGSTARCS